MIIADEYSKVNSMDGPNAVYILFLITNQMHQLFKFIVIKLYMFRASSLPIIGSFLLYIRHW